MKKLLLVVSAVSLIATPAFARHAQRRVPPQSRHLYMEAQHGAAPVALGSSSRYPDPNQGTGTASNGFERGHGYYAADGE